MSSIHLIFNKHLKTLPEPKEYDIGDKGLLKTRKKILSSQDRSSEIAET